MNNSSFNYFLRNSKFLYHLPFSILFAILSFGIGIPLVIFFYIAARSSYKKNYLPVISIYEKSDVLMSNVQIVIPVINGYVDGKFINILKNQDKLFFVSFERSTFYKQFNDYSTSNIIELKSDGEILLKKTNKHLHIKSLNFKKGKMTISYSNNETLILKADLRNIFKEYFNPNLFL